MFFIEFSTLLGVTSFQSFLSDFGPVNLSPNCNLLRLFDKNFIRNMIKNYPKEIRLVILITVFDIS